MQGCSWRMGLRSHPRNLNISLKSTSLLFCTAACEGHTQAYAHADRHKHTHTEPFTRAAQCPPRQRKECFDQGLTSSSNYSPPQITWTRLGGQGSGGVGSCTKSSHRWQSVAGEKWFNLCDGRNCAPSGGGCFDPKCNSRQQGGGWGKSDTQGWLARTGSMHRVWPYIWWFLCQKYGM